MLMQEKIRRIREHLNREPNIAISTSWPVELYTNIGETEVLIHVQVVAQPEDIQSGSRDEEGWEAAYGRVFGHPSFNDDPIEVQAKMIFDNWTRKGFKKDAKGKHLIEQALFYLDLVIMAPASYGAPSCFERGKTLIMAHCLTENKG